MNSFEVITRQVFNFNNINSSHSAAVNYWSKAIDIIKIRDDHSLINLEDFLGDCFCPKSNHGIDPEILKKEKKEYIARIESEGIFGIGLIVNGEIDYSSFVWGFVGDEYLGSGYDSDLVGLMGCISV